jgi:hypothetical protein
MADSNLFKTGGGLSRLGAALDNPVLGEQYSIRLSYGRVRGAILPAERENRNL